MYVGGVSVVAGGGGTLLGGLAVKKLGLKVKGLLKMTSITQFMAILTAIGLVAKCPPLETIGPNQNLTELCNCNCDSYDYQPVCSQDGSLQFYNPCYAGCQTKHPHTQGLFLNCSCIPLLADNLGSINLQDNISSVTSATAGKCDSDCLFLPVFLVSFFLTMCITFLANIPTLTATLRCVDPSVRSLALGIQWLLIRLLGTIPGPVAMGRLFDNACQLWREDCAGFSKDCFDYSSDMISVNILTLTAICKGLSIAFFLSGVRMYRYDSDDEEETNSKKLEETD